MSVMTILCDKMYTCNLSAFVFYKTTYYMHFIWPGFLIEISDTHFNDNPTRGYKTPLDCLD